MSRRTEMLQVVRAGVETNFGSPAVADHQFQALALALKPQTEISLWRPAGCKYPTAALPGREWTEGSLSGVMSYNELTYLLAALLGSPNSEGSGAVSRVFELRGASADLPQSLSLMKGEAEAENGARRLRCCGAVLSSLELQFKRSGCQISGKVLAQALEEGFSELNLHLEGSPEEGGFTITCGGESTSNLAYNASAAEVATALGELSVFAGGEIGCEGGPLPGNGITLRFGGFAALAAADFSLSHTLSGGSDPAAFISEIPIHLIPHQPVLPAQVSVYLAENLAGLENAAVLEGVLSLSWSVNEKYSPFWSLDAARSVHGDLIEAPGELRLQLKMEADASALQLLEVLRQGQTRYLRVEALGGEISGGVPYRLRLDTACKVEKLLKFSDEDGLYAVQWQLAGVQDAGWGQAASITLVNDLASL